VDLELGLALRVTQRDRHERHVGDLVEREVATDRRLIARQRLERDDLAVADEARGDQAVEADICADVPDDATAAHVLGEDILDQRLARPERVAGRGACRVDPQAGRLSMRDDARAVQQPRAQRLDDRADQRPELLAPGPAQGRRGHAVN
jgi:hypothetical protein